MTLYPEFHVKSSSNLKLYQIQNDKQKVYVFHTNTISKSIKIPIPNFIFVKQIDDIIFFKSLTKNISFEFLNFHKNIEFLVQFVNKKFKKYLILKGLGMRILYFKSSHTLTLKLGFSNLIYITVPRSLKILRKNNILIIEGSNGVLVGNFTNLIRNLKKPDNYKGKGFWYKNEVRAFKTIKKT